MKRILHWIANKRPGRKIVGPNQEPYLERYFLFHIPLLNITAYLHHFVDSDPDRGLHDHPWGWACSLVLTGGYTELRAVNHDLLDFEIQIIKRKAGRFNFLTGDAWHRVMLKENQDAWTLFIHGRRKKGWGFIQYEAVSPFRDRVTRQEPFTINRRWENQKWWKKRT